METTHVMPDDTIERALEAVKRRINELHAQQDELANRLAAEKEEEQLLSRLLAVRRGELLPTRVQAPPVQPVAKSATSRSVDSPIDVVIEELTSAGRPLHISDLMRLLAMRRVEVPGAGTQANLITYLRRDPRFVRPSRGMYALTEWGIDSMPPSRRRKRRKKAKAVANNQRINT